MQDRSIRSLEKVQNSASTARVLNLWALAQRMRKDPDHRDRPLFQNRLLNESILVKHRLRGPEADLFVAAPFTATKILLPIDRKELRTGARYVFLGQRDCELILQTVFGLAPGADCPDRQVLRMIDELPSLDPFLMREQLKRNGIEPARCYFDLSAADIERMHKFVQNELQPLVDMSFKDETPVADYAAKLTAKILSDQVGEDLEPMRQTLQLDPRQFQEGMFCWKAFLYYKWQLDDMIPRISAVMREIGQIRPQGRPGVDARRYIDNARQALRRKVFLTCESVKQTLKIYDAAYDRMTRDGEPLAFRDFLLKAPELFRQLGERLGAIEHIVSFWRYRFAIDTVHVVFAEELTEIFADFDAGLNFGEKELVEAAPIQAATG